MPRRPECLPMNGVLAPVDWAAWKLVTLVVLSQHPLTGGMLSHDVLGALDVVLALRGRAVAQQRTSHAFSRSRCSALTAEQVPVWYPITRFLPAADGRGPTTLELREADSHISMAYREAMRSVKGVANVVTKCCEPVQRCAVLRCCGGCKNRVRCYEAIFPIRSSNTLCAAYGMCVVVLMELQPIEVQAIAEALRNNLQSLRKPYLLWKKRSKSVREIDVPGLEIEVYVSCVLKTSRPIGQGARVLSGLLGTAAAAVVAVAVAVAAALVNYLSDNLLTSNSPFSM
ncbi:hypothetical protein AC579_8117 [Pseudocercospora musae]|uniref:Uncharacterized protein n=1 Tax=Pseudocercospora musae TaxID=113226 RepID=A0A139IG70_9PEZI|nr:hypothetical protein AC579_8117 [Pseudocercospora musae]